MTVSSSRLRSKRSHDSTTEAHESEIEVIEDSELTPEPKKKTLKTKETCNEDFIPPSVPLPPPTHSTTFLSSIPSEILTNPLEPVVLGVDEAGRGPVLGPMVYGISYCLKSFEPVLKTQYKFADSKTLTDVRRTNLLESISTQGSELYKNVGWATRTMTALDISRGMLRCNSIGNYNLNEQAHDATMDLIQDILNLGEVNIREIYVDTVGPPQSYQAKLQERFPGIQITVAKKADALYPIVSTASICAKVTRDKSLEQSRVELFGEFSTVNWGSGYPSDPNTKRWLNEEVDKLTGWSEIVRYSWQTSRDSIKRAEGFTIEWSEDNLKEDLGFKSIDGVFGKKSNDTDLEKLDVSMLWFGKNGGLL
ncbi:hypothetical protein WICPIJ_005838 [Wickerhamomyces pijperi]|uniref:Ribonuclease n=1 Tax=Wickerhamomyces pijperi TaxID=599730 RepID=A0A9P8TKR2_WICPI|nr:hypothetical protein WICPIJ_005838 [Wickerhamomyces pijperi]